MLLHNAGTVLSEIQTLKILLQTDPTGARLITRVKSAHVHGPTHSVQQLTARNKYLNQFVANHRTFLPAAVCAPYGVTVGRLQLRH